MLTLVYNASGYAVLFQKIHVKGEWSTLPRHNTAITIIVVLYSYNTGSLSTFLTNLTYSSSFFCAIRPVPRFMTNTVCSILAIMHNGGWCGAIYAPMQITINVYTVFYKIDKMILSHNIILTFILSEFVIGTKLMKVSSHPRICRV